MFNFSFYHFIEFDKNTSKFIYKSLAKIASQNLKQTVLKSHDNDKWTNVSIQNSNAPIVSLDIS